MGILLWMWLVLAFPVALLIDMLMTPKGNRDDGRGLAAGDADADRMAVPDPAIQRQREEDRIRLANLGGRHAPAE
ncbi:MAG: hypothetical protein WCO11_09190 [Sphingomonadales bacterium]